MQQNALYVFIVTKVNRQNISPEIFSFIFQVGAGFCVIFLSPGPAVSQNPCIQLLKTAVRQLDIVYKWMLSQIWAVNLITNFSVPPAQRPA